MADNTGTHRDLIKDTVHETFIFAALAKVHASIYSAKKRHKPDCSICLVVIECIARNLESEFCLINRPLREMSRMMASLD